MGLCSGSTSWSGKEPDPSCSVAPYRIFNIGNSRPVRLIEFIRTIEQLTGRKAILEYMPMQPGDVKQTWANVEALNEVYRYEPDYQISEGIRHFLDWYKNYNIQPV